MNTADEIKKHKLTVFLIGNGYAEIEDFISIYGPEKIDIKMRMERSVL